MAPKTLIAGHSGAVRAAVHPAGAGSSRAEAGQCVVTGLGRRTHYLPDSHETSLSPHRGQAPHPSLHRSVPSHSHAPAPGTSQALKPGLTRRGVAGQGVTFSLFLLVATSSAFPLPAPSHRFSSLLSSPKLQRNSYFKQETEAHPGGPEIEILRPRGVEGGGGRAEAQTGGTACPPRSPRHADP